MVSGSRQTLDHVHFHSAIGFFQRRASPVGVSVGRIPIPIDQLSGQCLTDATSIRISLRTSNDDK